MVLASGGKTSDWYLLQMLKWKELHKHIKNATGIEVNLGEIDEIPPDWLDAILALEIDVPRKAEVIARVKQGK